MGVLEIADQSEFFEIDRWWVQYLVIYDIFLRLNHCNSFSRYRVSLADSYTNHTLNVKLVKGFHEHYQALSSASMSNGTVKFNRLHGKSLKCANRLSSNFFPSFFCQCTFNVAAIFFGTIPTYGVLLYAMIVMRTPLGPFTSSALLTRAHFKQCSYVATMSWSTPKFQICKREQTQNLRCQAHLAHHPKQIPVSDPAQS